MKKNRIGLLANQASVDSDFLHTADRIQASGDNLAVLFSPQHGFSGHTQANMVEVGDGHDERRNLPVFSLYGDVRRPTEEMLSKTDRIIVDLQDVGARGYTFVWTMLEVMRACVDKKIPIEIWDRPNPINGEDMEGPIVKKEFFSFVGMHDIPIRHGMTMGELALMFNAELKLGLQVEVRKMDDWRRGIFFDETNRPWIPPSPNMPFLSTTLVYPGMELLEGTNLSEGRGTTRPFEIFGAPFIESNQLCELLKGYGLKGVHFRPASFEPKFDKWKDRLCHGAQIHVTEKKEFRSVATAVAILKSVIHLYPERFSFLDPPYEYENVKMPFDILIGSDCLKHELLSKVSLQEILAGWFEDLEVFRKRREEFLLYS